MKLFKCLLTASLLISAGCSYPQTPPTSGPIGSSPTPSSDVLEHCVNKYSHQVIDFYDSQRTDVVSKFFPSEKISEIIDVNGDHVIVNSREWKYDYICTTKKVTH